MAGGKGVSGNGDRVMRGAVQSQIEAIFLQLPTHAPACHVSLPSPQLPHVVHPTRFSTSTSSPLTQWQARKERPRVIRQTDQQKKKSTQKEKQQNKRRRNPRNKCRSVSVLTQRLMVSLSIRFSERGKNSFFRQCHLCPPIVPSKPANAPVRPEALKAVSRSYTKLPGPEDDTQYRPMGHR